MEQKERSSEKDLVGLCQRRYEEFGVWTCPKRMRSLGINGEGKSRGQPANPGSPGKWPLLRRACVCVRACACVWLKSIQDDILCGGYNYDSTSIRRPFDGR